MLNLLYGYLQHKLFTFDTNDYNFDTFCKVKQEKLSCLAASHSQMSFPVPVAPFLHALQMEIVTATSNSGVYFFFECFFVAFALYAFYEYMFLRRTIEKNCVPSVLVHY